MRFSLRLNNDLPAAEYVTLAQAAEAYGFDQFWMSDDLFLRSAPVILATVAMRTSRIQIGTSIVNPYTLHPATMAMAAATLDEISGGRFILGISAGAADFLKWVGISQDRPLTTVFESVQAVRKLLHGERAAMDGHFLKWTDEAYLRFKPLRRQIPIYLGALSPNMLRAIGEWADGGLPLLFPPEHFKVILPYIQEGAAKAGRPLDEIDLSGCVWCAISEDRRAAERALAAKIAYYGHALSPLIWASLGVTAEEFAPIEQTVMAENDMEKAITMVTPAMMQIGLVGEGKDLIPRLEALASLGLRHISFGPPLGTDRLQAIQIIGREIIPHFKGRHA